MYNPAQPNVYKTVRMELEVRRREKRRREASEKERTPSIDSGPHDLMGAQQHGRGLDHPLGGLSMSASLATVASPSSWLEAQDGGSIGGGVQLQLDAATLVKERLQQSAAMGVASAQEMLREEQEVHHKQHVQQGKDMKSKIGKLLGKLSEGAPSAQSSHLVFAPAALAAGGHVVTTAANAGMAPDARKAIRGKPSSTIYMHLAASDPTAVALRIEHVDQLMGPWVCQALQQACAKCGVVRASRRWHCPALAAAHADADAVDAVASPPDGARTATPSPLTLAPVAVNDGGSGGGATEAVRFMVRFDSVASAFKAAEKMDAKLLSEFCAANGLSMPAPSSDASQSTPDAVQLRVSFYPTNLFDGGVLDAAV